MQIRTLFNKITMFVFIIVWIYITVVFKMPWLYKTSFSPKTKINLLDKDYYSTYLCFVATGNDTDLNQLKNAGVSFCAPYMNDGSTLLHNAAYHNKIDPCRWLIEYAHINPNVKNNAGLTPLDCVLWKGEVYEYIKKSGGRHSWRYYFWLQFLNFK